MMESNWTDKVMTDTQKIEALTELLQEVIHSLDLKQYDIEDPTQSHQCEVEANNYYYKMHTILYSKDEEDTCFGVHLTDEQCDKLDAYLDTLN